MTFQLIFLLLCVFLISLMKEPDPIHYQSLICDCYGEKSRLLPHTRLGFCGAVDVNFPKDRLSRPADDMRKIKGPLLEIGFSEGNHYLFVNKPDKVIVVITRRGESPRQVPFKEELMDRDQIRICVDEIDYCITYEYRKGE